MWRGAIAHEVNLGEKKQKKHNGDTFSVGSKINSDVGIASNVILYPQWSHLSPDWSATKLQHDPRTDYKW